jgi:hypothetical protein
VSHPRKFLDPIFRLRSLEGNVRKVLIATAFVLSGCVAHQSTLNYIRTDGAQIDAAREQAVLAQCKGEGATATVQTVPSPYGVVERERKRNTIIDACTARNGYSRAQQ